MESKLEAAYKLHQEVIRETEELSRQTDTQLPAYLRQGLKRHRITPMLGFLEGVIGPDASLLTYDDGQRIEEKIINLYQVVAN